MNNTMFINVTNCSSVDWDDRQWKEAANYGKVVDLSFQEVDAGWTTSEIMGKASVMADRITKMIWESMDMKNGVLVMGELSYAYALIQELQSRKVKVLCATYAIELYENEEIIQHFVKFREYSLREVIEEDE